jgi:hypothetical protein
MKTPIKVGSYALGRDLSRFQHLHPQVPSAGAYRLFLDFRHAGTVRTAEFTALAGNPPHVAAPGTAEPTPSPSGGHDAGHRHN